MAIQMRRGSYSDFVPSRMLAGEFAVMTADDPNTANGKSVYMAMAPSDVQRILTETDLGDMTDAAERAEAAIDAIGDISELAVPLMTQDVRGGAKLGAGLQIDANDKLGVKVDGTTITVDSGGTIHGASTYELPTMTANIKGGAKLGSGLRVDDDTLSVGNLVHSGSGAEVVTDGCAIFSVDGEGWATQDGTPTPDNPVPIEVCRGRNLLDTSALTSGKYLDASGAETAATAAAISDYIAVTGGASYACSGFGAVGSYYATWYTSAKAYISTTQESASSFTLTAPANAAYVRVSLLAANLGQSQLELGTTPSPYVPYGCVGLEVTHDGTTTVTPIPLPAKGFAASLPNGTADALAIDSAGRWEWTGVADESDLSQLTWSANNGYWACWAGIANLRKPATNSAVLSAMCSTLPLASYNSVASMTGIGVGIAGYILANNASTSDKPTGILLYPLATPTTESGYIDLPDLPEGATVSIPELKQIGCSWFIAGVDELAKHAANWGARALASETRIAALEAAVAELATS